MLVVGLCAGLVLVAALLAGSGRAAAPGPVGRPPRPPSPRRRATSPSPTRSSARAARSATSAASTTLRVGGPSQTRSYLRFTLPQPYAPGGPPVRLRLFATVGARSGVAVRLVRAASRGASARSPPARRRASERSSRATAPCAAGAWLTIDITRARRAAGASSTSRSCVAGPGRCASSAARPARRQGSAARPRRRPRRPIRSWRPPATSSATPTSPNRRDKVAGHVPGPRDLRPARDARARRPCSRSATSSTSAGTLAAFRSSYDRTWGRVKAITRPVVGNHEYETPGAAGYFDYFNGPGRATGRAGRRGEGWYSFDVGALAPRRAELDLRRGRRLRPRLAPARVAAGRPRGAPGAVHARLLASPALLERRPRLQRPHRRLLAAALRRRRRRRPRPATRTTTSASRRRRPTRCPTTRAGSAQFVVGTGGKNNYPFGIVAANSEVRDAVTSRRAAADAASRRLRLALRAGARRPLRDAGSGDCH